MLARLFVRPGVAGLGVAASRAFECLQFEKQAEIGMRFPAGELRFRAAFLAGRPIERAERRFDFRRHDKSAEHQLRAPRHRGLKKRQHEDAAGETPILLR